MSVFHALTSPQTPATFKDGVETYVQQLTLDNGRGTITLRHIVKDPTHKRTYVRGSDFIVPIKQVTGVLVLADLKFDDDPVAGDSCVVLLRPPPPPNSPPPPLFSGTPCRA